MSNKRSDYGSLADRTGRGNETANSAVDRPFHAGVHVSVRTDAGEVAGLLAGWRRQEDGAWWGRVILVTDGQPSEALVRADLLRKPPATVAWRKTTTGKHYRLDAQHGVQWPRYRRLDTARRDLVGAREELNLPCTAIEPNADKAFRAFPKGCDGARGADVGQGYKLSLHAL